MSEIHFDFAVILTVLTAVTGVVWALDKVWLGPKRRGGLPEGTVGVTDKPGAITDFCRSFFPVILIVLLLRSFLAEPFRIPSGSMIPTLAVGDFILVNKFTYGLRDPVAHFKFLKVGEPKRGDVVVFRYPVDPRQDFIKRCIGVPGDRIAYRDKKLYVNGEPQVQVEGDVYTAAGPMPGVMYGYRETLNGVEHAVIVNPARPSEDFEIEVPEGQYFMMGDNRDGSLDSRSWGFVPEKNLVGKAFFVWMSWDAANFRPDFSRIGNAIH